MMENFYSIPSSFKHYIASQMRIFVTAFGLALLITANQAGAALVSGDDPGFGTDSVTIDTDTNLAWLDLASTKGRSFNDVSSQLGAGGDFEGFRYATENEVLTLFSNAGIPDLPAAGTTTPVSSIANYTPIDNLHDLIGTTNTSATFALGLTATVTLGGTNQVTAYTLLSGSNGEVSLSFTLPSSTNASSGSWLVKEATPQSVVVAIDIKPGSDPNSINLCSNGAVPVAILGFDTFDVYTINTETLRFAEAAVKVVGKKDPHSLCSYEDVNGDSYVDLVCHYVTTDIAGIDGESTTATVNGELLDNGTPIEGTDNVNIVKDTCN